MYVNEIEFRHVYSLDIIFFLYIFYDKKDFQYIKKE